MKKKPTVELPPVNVNQVTAFLSETEKVCADIGIDFLGQDGLMFFGTALGIYCKRFDRVHSGPKHEALKALRQVALQIYDTVQFTESEDQTRQ